MLSAGARAQRCYLPRLPNSGSFYDAPRLTATPSPLGFCVSYSLYGRPIHFALSLFPVLWVYRCLSLTTTKKKVPYSYPKISLAPLAAFQTAAFSLSPPDEFIQSLLTFYFEILLRILTSRPGRLLPALKSPSLPQDPISSPTNSPDPRHGGSRPAVPPRPPAARRLLHEDYSDSFSYCRY